MTASGTIDVDAAPTSVAWGLIDWAKCYHEVKKLQVRIAKATGEKRWRKVKALQWLLTHSFTAKVLAVKRVTENQGKRTPGVDGKVWSTPGSKMSAIDTLKRRGYKPLPLRRMYIPKSNGKRRPLGIPTMRDRAMQALYLFALEPVAETTMESNSYGFRPERSTSDATSHLFILLSRKGAAQWILEGDIESCFDKISHQWIVDKVPLDKRMLSHWLKSGFIDKGKLFPTNEGTPQGGIISPTLANLALDGLENLLAINYGSLKINGHDSRTRKYQVHFVRYADDFVITAKSKSVLENEVKPKVSEFLATRGLRLSEKKTKITHISEGFDFLGQHVRKYRLGKSNERLLIKPASKNVQAFKLKVKKMVKKLGTAKQEEVIGVLNPIILGWANYHRHIVAKETFAKVDHFIWHLLWRWACRRHNNKSLTWIKKRYYKAIENRRQMTFACESKTANGKSKLMILRHAADVKIIRHTKIINSANPYDPSYEEYFEKRLSEKMTQTLKGRRKLFYLWNRQQGTCPVCQQSITKITHWHLHHIVKRIDGGSEHISNRILLHPECHRQVHLNGSQVELLANFKKLVSKIRNKKTD